MRTPSGVRVGGLLAMRHVVGNIRIPGAIVTVIGFPIFSLVAFGGAFGGLTLLPGFPTTNSLNWFTPFAILLGTAFAGMGTAYLAARDFESEFSDRLLLTRSPRQGLLLGAVLGSMCTAVLQTAAVLLVAYLGGARFVQRDLGLAVLVVASLGVAALSGLWALGVVARVRTQRGLAPVQAGIFAVMFLSVGQIPLDYQVGWLHAVARANPITAVLDMARQGFVGEVTWQGTRGGVVVLVAGLLALGVFAARGIRALDC